MKVITLTLSPAFDIHCHTAVFNAERENFAKISSNDVGGKGINISRALTAVGSENLAIVAISDENGAFFQAQLDKTDLNYVAIPVKGRIRENITIHTSQGKETRLSFDGFDADDSIIDKLSSIMDDVAKSGDVVTLTGSIPRGINVSKVKVFIKQLAKRNIKAVLDSRSFNCDDMIECSPFLIKPNEEEIEKYLGRSLKDLDDAAKVANELHVCGIENVMITLGDRGALLACNDGVFYANAPQTSVISTIGAGDSSIAGFLTAYQNQRSSAECLTTAVAYGSAACLTHGTCPPKPEDIEYFLKCITTKKCNKIL